MKQLNINFKREPKGLFNICYKVMSLNTHRLTDICVGYSLTQILLKMQKYTPYSIEELQDKYNKNDNTKEFIPESILKKLQLEEKMDNNRLLVIDNRPPKIGEFKAYINSIEKNLKKYPHALLWLDIASYSHVVSVIYLQKSGTYELRDNNCTQLKEGKNIGLLLFKYLFKENNLFGLNLKAIGFVYLFNRKTSTADAANDLPK